LNGRLGLLGLLLVIGAGWGATLPLAKIAVSTGHGPLGLIFWQLVIAALILGAVQFWRRRALPMGRGPLLVYLVIALTGTLLPNSASYVAARHLPAGILSIAIASVPMMALPMALALGIDRFGWGRLAGLALGLLGVVLIALPEASLPGPGMTGWLLLALVAPFFYAVEGNYVARWGTAGCGAIQALLGASLLGAALAAPLALASGQWIDPREGLGRAEAALILSSTIHALAYAGYVWLIGRSGAVFAAQVSYIVTGTGVLWAMTFLGERYSGWVWLALAAVMAGLFLVQPRPKDTLASPALAAKDSAPGGPSPRERGQ
jgi:drug/metabolite transporter (DMT)-like permease